jgi:hypothetical protein
LAGRRSFFVMFNLAQCVAVARGPKGAGDVPAARLELALRRRRSRRSDPAPRWGAPWDAAWLAAVRPVERGDLVCLRQGRVVEDGISQILDRSAVVDEDLHNRTLGTLVPSVDLMRRLRAGRS